MFKDIIMGITCILLGGFTFSFWCFAMFSGSDWGEFAREMLDGGFNLGRNTIAVIEPAVGVFFVSVGCGMVLDPGASGGGVLRNLCVFVAGVSLVVGVLGLVPVRLPGWMYPEWHEERRWRRREQAGWEAKYGSDDEGDGETG